MVVDGEVYSHMEREAEKLRDYLGCEIKSTDTLFSDVQTMKLSRLTLTSRELARLQQKLRRLIYFA